MAILHCHLILLVLYIKKPINLLFYNCMNKNLSSNFASNYRT